MAEIISEEKPKKINALPGVYCKIGKKPRYKIDGYSIVNRKEVFGTDMLGSHIWFKQNRQSLSVYTDFGGGASAKADGGTFKLGDSIILDKVLCKVVGFSTFAAVVLTEETVGEEKKYTLRIKRFSFGAWSDEFYCTPELYCSTEFNEEVNPEIVFIVDDSLLVYENKDGFLCSYSFDSAKSQELKDYKDFAAIVDKMVSINMLGQSRNR